MARVVLKGVTKIFGKTTAVNKIDLEVPDKRFVVLLGPSGCGKTTVLRLVAGLDCLIAHESKAIRALDIAELAIRNGATRATIHDQHTNETITTAEVLAIRGASCL